MSIDSLVPAVPAVLFLGAIARLLTGREKSRRWVFLPAVVACYLATATLLWLGGNLRPVLRAELLALDARLENADGQPRRVTLGGADGRDGGPADSFYVPGYPHAAFELRRDRAHPQTWHLMPGPGWRPELIAWSGGKPVMMKDGLPALEPLFSGDRLDLPTSSSPVKADPHQVGPPSPSSTPSGLAITYREAQPWKHSSSIHLADGRGWTLPNRRIEIPILGKEVPVLKRLPWQQRVYPLQESGLLPLTKSVILHGLDHPEALGAHLLVLDQGLQVHGPRHHSESKVWQALIPGAPLRLDELVPASAGRPARLITRRSFKALEIIPAHAKEATRVRLVPEQPEVKSIPERRVLEVPEGVMPRLRLNDRFVESSSSFQVPELLFSKLTSRHDEAGAELRLERDGWHLRDDNRDTPLAWGSSLFLGRDHRLEVRLERVAVPWHLIGLTLLGGLLSAAAFWVMPDRAGMGALFFGLSSLAGMRVLCAQAAWVNPPHDATVVTVAAQVIWILPVLLSVFWLALPLLTKLLQQWLTQARQGWTYPALILTVCLLLGLRILLGLAGFKEALALPGFRLALSMFFVPAHLVLFALALCRLEADRRAVQVGSSLQPLIRFGLFVALVMVPAQLLAGVFVSDLGTLLYLLPPALVVAAQGLVIAVAEARAFLRSQGTLRESSAITLLGALLLVLPAAGIASILAHPLDVVRVLPEVRAALDDQGRHVVTESNVLRLMQFIDEKTLSDIGTDEAQRIRQDHALMRAYARCGLLGKGYLGVNVVRAKHETAANDNVCAIYVLAQFGATGGWVLLVAYFAIMAGSSAWRQKCLLGRHVSMLAGLALGLVSLYMMAANSGLLPFTGRNMYLLGLNSLGDVAETTVLVLLLVAGATWKTEPEAHET